MYSLTGALKEPGTGSAISEATKTMAEQFDPEDTTVKESDIVVEPNGNMRLPDVDSADSSLPLILLAGAAILLIGLTKK